MSEQLVREQLVQALKAFMGLPHLFDDVCVDEKPDCKVCAAIRIGNAALAAADADAATQKSAWIPVSERLPERSDRTFYFCKLTQAHMDLAFTRHHPWEIASGWYINAMPQLYTHWQPITEPPAKVPVSSIDPER